MFGLDEFGAWLLYTVEYYLGQLLWQIGRSFLYIALIAQSADEWLTENIGSLVETIVNSLATPLGMFLTLAIAALGLWFVVNNLLPSKPWVDPQKLFFYAFVSVWFFSSPLVALGLLETMRTSIRAGVDVILISDSVEDLFPDVTGDDNPLPPPVGVADVNNDGLIGSFDLVCYLLYVGNGEEIGRIEFPTAFAEGDGRAFPGFFPHGDPSTINLESEETREEAINFAWAGINQLAFAWFAIPTAIAEHILWLALTMTAILLYAGLPIGLLFSFFTYTEALLGVYIRQYINLLIETLMSVCIVTFVVGMVAAAAEAGTGIYVGMSVAATVIIAWRIKSAIKLATNAFDLFGAANLTGGSGGRELLNMGTGAVVTGAALATGGTALAGAAVLATDRKLSQTAGLTERGFTGQDLSKTGARVHQLTALGGYMVSGAKPLTRTIETAHEARTLARNFAEGGMSTHEPDSFDFLRVGTAMGKFGGSQWMATRLSDSYNRAIYEVGGRRRRSPTTSNEEGNEASEDRPRTPSSSTSGRHMPPSPDAPSDEDVQSRHQGSRTAVQRNTPPPPPPLWEDGEFETGTPTPPNGQPTPAIRLATVAAPEHQQAIQEVITGLQEPTSPQTQTALESIVGPGNAQILQQAVMEHGVEAVQTAVSGTTTFSSKLQQQGQQGAAILHQFQSGAALAAIREATHTPLDDSQLRAVADLVLLPRQELSRVELGSAMVTAVIAGGDSEQDVADQLALPATFGSYTGAIRGVMAGILHMNLSQQEMREISQAMQAGKTAEMRQRLIQQGQTPQVVDDFFSDLESLPERLSIPQSTQPISGVNNPAKGEQTE